MNVWREKMCVCRVWACVEKALGIYGECMRKVYVCGKFVCREHVWIVVCVCVERECIV